MPWQYGSRGKDTGRDDTTPGRQREMNSRGREGALDVEGDMVGGVEGATMHLVGGMPPLSKVLAHSLPLGIWNTLRTLFKF
jgi:hypothetical protein